METLSTTLGDTATGNGTVTVTGAGFGGPGSNLTIGNAGIGTFSASNVSSIYSAATYIGALAGSSGTATLSGSEWNVLGDFEIGSAGSGSLTVTGGAELTSLSEAIIGADVGSSGTVTLTGSGSTWTDNSTVYVGDNGTGTLTISDGAVFNGSNLEVGYSEGSTGTVTLTGSRLRGQSQQRPLCRARRQRHIHCHGRGHAQPWHQLDVHRLLRGPRPVQRVRWQHGHQRQRGLRLLQRQWKRHGQHLRRRNDLGDRRRYRASATRAAQAR